jgi:hypothetical protein
MPYITVGRGNSAPDPQAAALGLGGLHHGPGQRLPASWVAGYLAVF